MAGTASAAGGSISASVSPNKAKARSGLTISAAGPFSGVSGLPTSIQINVQKGFATSAKSVKTLCSDTSACPSESQIGSGEAQATGSDLGLSIPVTIPLTLYLAKPIQGGDIAAVVLVEKVSVPAFPTLGGTYTETGRLFGSNGGLEILFSTLPTISLPAGATVTLNSLDLSAKKVRSVTKKVKKHHKTVNVTTHYSLITNPGSCPHGSWTGSFKITFETGSFSHSVSIPCKKT